MDTQQTNAQLQKIEKRISELETVTTGEGVASELESLRRELETVRTASAPELNPVWKRVELARHPQRPYFLDLVQSMCTDFVELHGDRRFGDDAAIVGGMARFHGREVMVIGQQRGRELKERIRRNFGQPKPEGYRKAMRLMRMAEKFKRPILTFVDTQGAYPGLDAEERGQAEAIAFNLREMTKLAVPVITTVTGEGGSGGALGIAIANRVLMLENSIYSVISPEGCASIMWRDSTKKDLAAAALRITASELLELRIIDEVVPEPAGGAHLDPCGAAEILSQTLQRHLSVLEGMSAEELRNQRYRRFREIGQFFTE